MIHDKTDKTLWTDSVRDWEEEFEHNDIVISKDIQMRLNNNTIVVSRIDFLNPNEYVNQLGLFWKERNAEVFANAIHDELHG